MKKTICLVLLVIILGACNKAKVIDPVCVATQGVDISFKKDVIPILQKNCWTCHNSANHSGGLVLETYQQVSDDAKSGELYDAIVSLNGNPPRMPKGGALTECEVATIKKWIDMKMLDN